MCTNARSKQLDYPSFIMLKSCIHMLHTVQHRPPLRKCTLPLISKKQPAIPLKKKIKSLIYLYSSIVTKIPWTDHFWLGSYKLCLKLQEEEEKNKDTGIKKILDPTWDPWNICCSIFFIWNTRFISLVETHVASFLNLKYKINWFLRN